MPFAAISRRLSFATLRYMIAFFAVAVDILPLLMPTLMPYIYFAIFYIISRAACLLLLARFMLSFYRLGACCLLSCCRSLCDAACHFAAMPLLFALAYAFSCCHARYFISLEMRYVFAIRCCCLMSCHEFAAFMFA